MMMKWLARFGAVVAAALAAAPRVMAQGCAMCYQDAAAQSPRAKHMLDLAILTLLIPTLAMFGGVMYAAFRRREQDRTFEDPAKFGLKPSRPAPRRAPRTVPAPDALL